jgi:hypothetical protein
MVDNYNELHKCNLDIVKLDIEKFYKNLILDSERLDLLQEDFKKELRKNLLVPYKKLFGKKIDFELFSIGYDEDVKTLKIFMTDSVIEANILNNPECVRLQS